MVTQERRRTYRRNIVRTKRVELIKLGGRYVFGPRSLTGLVEGGVRLLAGEKSRGPV